MGVTVKGYLGGKDKTKKGLLLVLVALAAERLRNKARERAGQIDTEGQ